MERLLSTGDVLLYDEEDADMVNGRKWYVFNPAPNSFYVQDCKGRSLHRILMNAPRGMCVDHINGNGLDNRRSNLRLCTKRQNNLNSRLRSDNSSGFRGVSFYPRDKTWRARVFSGNKVVYQESFKSKEECAIAYDRAVLRIRQNDLSFVRLNLSFHEQYKAE